MTRTVPPSITREQFEAIRPLLERHKRVTRRRSHDLYDVVNAMLHKLYTGCAWRALPGDIPWRTVHEYYYQWTMATPDGKPGLLPQVLNTLKETV
jgi:transposase